MLNYAEVYTDEQNHLLERSIPEPNTGCWLWLISINKDGYGVLTLSGKQRIAHRMSYEVFVGDIPRGMNVCHRCDVRCCINPEHLFLGTQKQNVQDSIAKGRASYMVTPNWSSWKRGVTTNSKVTVEQVRIIRRKEESVTALAERFNIGRSAVWRIQKGLTRKDVK